MWLIAIKKNLIGWHPLKNKKTTLFVQVKELTLRSGLFAKRPSRAQTAGTGKLPTVDNLQIRSCEMSLLSPFPSSVGGKEELRPYWQRYMSKAVTLVFVVDSSSRQLFPVAKKLLRELLTSDPHLPLMVLANKQVSVTGNTWLHVRTKDLRPSSSFLFFLKNRPQFVLCCIAILSLFIFVKQMLV